jgi:hypothetical protein
VSKTSKINVKIKSLDKDENSKIPTEIVQCGCFRLKQEPVDNTKIAPIQPAKASIELTEENSMH